MNEKPKKGVPAELLEQYVEYDRPENAEDVDVAIVFARLANSSLVIDEGDLVIIDGRAATKWVNAELRKQADHSTAREWGEA